MCIDAPESTTNSRFSGSRFDAGKHEFSEGEKNVALFFSFNFVDVMSVTVVRMTVARQSLNRAYSVSHQRKLRRHKLKGP